MTTFHAWFRTELEDEDPHEWTSELEAPDQTAAFARAYEALINATLQCQADFGNDAKNGVIKFGVGELESSIIV